LLPIIARYAALHTIGILVIDELQHLRAAASGGEIKMLNFFVNLSNIIGVPIFLVGTFAAQSLFTGEFRQARRLDGHGPNVWLPMTNGKAWHDFTKALWKYQFLDEPVDWDEDLAKVLLDVSQGIVDYACKIYFLAQVRGMVHGIKSLNKSLIKSVARDSLQLSSKILDAMKHNDWDDLERPEDLPPIDWDMLYERETKTELICVSSVNGNGHTNSSADANGHTNSTVDVSGESAPKKTPENAQTHGESKKKRAKPNNGNAIMNLIEAEKKKNKNATSHSALKQAGLIRDLSAVINPCPEINNRARNEGNTSGEKQE
jgi:hypothetical protein